MTAFKSKIKYLDKLFSKYVRKRDTADGFGFCISCGCRITYDTCDCGHYIPGRHLGLRFDVYNAHAQCGVCNTVLSGNIIKYRKNLIKKIGLDCVEALEARSHEVVKLTEFDLDEIGERIKRMLEEL